MITLKQCFAISSSLVAEIASYSTVADMAVQATCGATKSWKLAAEHGPIRLDAFVRRCLPHLSRREVEKAIGAGLFSVRQKVTKKGDRLSGGDELVFQGPESWLAANPRPEADLAVEIVYEDESILIVNKPAGMPTHGFSARHGSTLANFLLARMPQLASVGKSRWEPGLVHRLDRETSGLLVIAKTQPVFENLRSQFRRRCVKKIYWALAWGIAPAEGVIDKPLSHDPRDKGRMRPSTRPPRGKARSWKAVTRYRRLGQSRGVSLLEIDMETGVTHQIRVHLAAIGHPIVGDALYGDNKAKDFGLRRHFLHARSLTLLRPDDGETFTAEADLPGDLSGLLKRLNVKI
jgi:23S rRNA pseudouridine1911/1915/1917 synthase